MDHESRFSSELDDIRELPSSFSSAVARQISPHEVVGLLLYKPAERAGDVVSVPKTLVITDHGFVFAEDLDERPPRIVRAEFDAILLVELAQLLLYGHLKIDFVVGGDRQSIAMEYNTISQELYQRGAALLLENVSPSSHAECLNDPATALNTTDWPRPLARAIKSSLLPDTPAIGAAWWPTVRSGFGHGLAPAGAIVIHQDRLTVLVVEEPGPWNRVLDEPSYGTVVTYLPANRIARVDSQVGPILTVLELEMHADRGGERFQIAIPSNYQGAVRSIIDDVLPNNSEKQRLPH